MTVYTAEIYKDNWTPSIPWRANIYADGVRISDDGPYRSQKNLIANLESMHVEIDYHRDKTLDK